ncbi:MAG TPA: DNA-formamidopyrimidine glycosylase [Bacilli bacterium]|nr:DNA-formamidopyrimidine glycosylase [Bacilli bacterium]
MPELPEVETVRQTLQNLILDKRIIDCYAPYDRIIKHISFLEFKQAIQNQRITNVWRKGKYLALILEHSSIVIHLRMEGKFFIRSVSDHISKHEHVVFVLDDQSELRYQDTRKFGEMHLIHSTKIEDIIQGSPIKRLGFEPFEWVGNEEVLFDMLRKKQTSIKAALLDQHIIAGLGNIYVDEVCFLTKLHPETICNKLSKEDIYSIVKNACIVLNKAISLGGTTIRSYTSIDGVHGRFQNELFVHSREGLACLTCESIIQKMRVAGRGTYYCPKCQMNQSDKVLKKE